MDKNVRYLLTVGGIIILIIAAVIVYKNFQTNKTTPFSSNQGQSNNETNKSQTHLDLPENISVPEKNQQVAQDVAAPVSVIPASPQGNQSLRKFEIKAEGNSFKPSEVIVYTGDVVEIKVTAIDKEYDWIQPDYGFNVKIPKGTTKSIEFQATTAFKFVFYCESCCGIKSTSVGYVTIVPK